MGDVDYKDKYVQNQQRISEWNRNHPEKRKEYAKTYYEKNKEKCRAAQRAWYLKNKEKVRQYQRDRYQRMKLQQQKNTQITI